MCKLLYVSTYKPIHDGRIDSNGVHAIQQQSFPERLAAINNGNVFLITDGQCSCAFFT